MSASNNCGPSSTPAHLLAAAGPRTGSGSLTKGSNMAIMTPCEMDSAAQDLGVIHPTIDGMARSMFQLPETPSLVSEANPDPWVRDLSSGVNLVDHMLRTDAEQARLNPRVSLVAMKRTTFNIKEYESLYSTQITGEFTPYINGKRAAGLCSKAEIDKVMLPGYSCNCNKDCFAKWKDVLQPRLARAIITTERHAYGAMTQHARQEHYTSIIKTHLHMKTKVSSDGTGVVQTGWCKERHVYTVGTSKVQLCEKAFCLITGMSERTFQSYKSNARNGVRPLQVGRHFGQCLPKTEAARAFVSHFATLHDYIPNEVHKATKKTKIRLDVSEFQEVWYLYATFMIRAGFSYPADIIKQSTFYKLIAEEFPHLETRSKRTVSSKCLVCDDLEYLVRTEKDPKRLSLLRLLQYDHRLFQQAERQAYYNKRILAQEHPEMYCSMIVDGMQQATTDIPKRNHFSYEYDKLNQKLIGVLVHGADMQYLDIYRLPIYVRSGANATISAIWRSIKRLISSNQMTKDKTLFLQVDGGSENVNQTMLKFAAWLCYSKVCSQVIISRLPVGHTHEDIDQKFSVISRSLNNPTVDIMTPQDFTSVVKSSFLTISSESSRRVLCSFSDLVAAWDFTDWLDGQAPGTWPNELVNYAKRDRTVHSIRFTRAVRARRAGDEDQCSKVFIQTRKYCCSKVREVQTRDMSSSLSAADDTKLPFPKLVDMRCVWEPHDSACGLGKVFLDASVCGEPRLEAFAGDWTAKAQGIWDGLKKCYGGWHAFSQSVSEWEAFMNALPWRGLVDIPWHQLPSFAISLSSPGGNCTLASPPTAESVELERHLEGLTSIAGEDREGRPRLGFRNGLDTLSYPRAESAVAYNKHKLDGSEKQAKKRKRDELFVGQFVAVLVSGVPLAAELNISKLVGDTVLCALGRIQQLYSSSGEIVSAQGISQILGRYQLHRGGDVEASTPQSDTEISKLLVEWYGDPIAKSCHLQGVLRALSTVDTVPLSAVFYAEAKAGQVRMRKSHQIHKDSLKVLLRHAPPAVINSINSDLPAATSGQYKRGGQQNHAGITVANDPPTRHEKDSWDATLNEVKGFKWRPLASVIDEDPPLCEVTGIRRWDSTLFAVVETSNGDRQEDHLFHDVIKQKYLVVLRRSSMGVQRAGVHVPAVLTWESFHKSSLTIDFVSLEKCLNYFFRNTRSTNTVYSTADHFSTSSLTSSLLSDLPAAPSGGGSPLSVSDLRCMFEAEGSVGLPVTRETLARAVMLLQASSVRKESIMVASTITLQQGTLDTDLSDQEIHDRRIVPQETNRCWRLRLLAQQHGISEPTGRTSSHQWRDLIWSRVDRILLPYRMSNTHTVLFEIVFRSQHGEYIKVWDPCVTWRRKSECQRECQVLMDVFFEGREVDVFLWETKDPIVSGQCCVSLIFVSMAYLAQGKRPILYKEDDSAVARVFMWGSIMNGSMLPVPQPRLKPTLHV